MANSTDPENLMETTLRLKIYRTRYWDLMNNGLNLGLLIEKATDIDYIGCTFGDRDEPTHFICLLLKMLTVKPDMAILVKFIRNEDEIYARALGAFCLRLTASDVDVYYYLEPLYNDYRELKHRLSDGTFVVTNMHEFVTQLVTQQKMFDINLPRLTERKLLDLDLERRHGDGNGNESKRPLKMQWRRWSDLEIAERNKVRAALGSNPLPLNYRR